jgi:DNA-directed RNA polymerase subunit RPC12/RpoP
MQTRIIGIVLLLVGAGVAVWLGAGLGEGRSASGAALGFVLFSLPFLAVGLYLLLQSKGEIAQQSKADKQRSILNAVTTRGRVSVADLAIENDAGRDEVRDHIYDLIGKDLFHGFVNWERGELVSAEAAQIKEDTCPNCGGRVELAGKGLVRCPYCGTETFLSGPPSRVPKTPDPLPPA